MGDLTGKYTCYKYNGNSIVDYIMTQTTMLQKVVHFKVKPITLWSDHCQIQAALAIKKRSSSENTNPIKNSKVKKYRWENTSKNKVSNFIYSHEFKFVVEKTNEEVHSSSVHLEEKVQKVTNLLIQVSNKCLRMVKKLRKVGIMSILSQIDTIRGKNCKGWQICWERIQIILLSDNLTTKQNVSIKL